MGEKAIQENKDIPRSIKRAKPYAVFTEVDLEEVSQVVIPRNPDAVQKFYAEKPQEWHEVVTMAMDAGFYEKQPDEVDFESARLQMVVAANNALLKII